MPSLALARPLLKSAILRGIKAARPVGVCDGLALSAFGRTERTEVFVCPRHTATLLMLSQLIEEVFVLRSSSLVNEKRPFLTGNSIPMVPPEDCQPDPGT